MAVHLVVHHLLHVPLMAELVVAELVQQVLMHLEVVETGEQEETVLQHL